MRPLPTQPPATHEELRGFVPGASTVTAQVPSAVLIGESHASRPEKSPRQLPEQDTSQSSLTGHGTSPERYQQAPMDDGYNTGIVPPLSPVDLGPTDGFYGPTSPPSHDEAMGFNHQADGRAPTQIMPYPEKG